MQIREITFKRANKSASKCCEASGTSTVFSASSSAFSFLCLSLSPGNSWGITCGVIAVCLKVFSRTFDHNCCFPAPLLENWGANVS